MATELIRANRVAVKANGENFVADFYRTHKAICSVHSENTDWVAPEDVANKTATRESFRAWVIANCADYGIDWKPQDMRAEGNIRKAKYDSDQALIDDAMSMLIPQMQALVEKCKYDIKWRGVTYDDIEPKTYTGTGKDLSTMGITDGKYDKSGNWAWADIKFIVTLGFKGEECYLTVIMKLVSGQLKKAGMGITEFTNKVKAEIIDAGLATEEELDPPKEPKPKKSKVKESTEEESEPTEEIEVDTEENEEVEVDAEDNEEGEIDMNEILARAVSRGMDGESTEDETPVRRRKAKKLDK